MLDTKEINAYATRVEPADRPFLLASEPCLRLTLYAPFGGAGHEPARGKEALLDLRRQAVSLLAARGSLPGEADAILAPIDKLLAEPNPARMPCRGVAVFADREASRIFLLPHAPAPWLHVDRRFRLDGILDMWFARDRYYLLALSQHSVRLWDCDGVAVREIALDGLDTDIRETPHFEEKEYQALFRTRAGAGAGPTSAYSGIGADDGRNLKKEIEVFFRQIDHGIRTRLPKLGLPMLLAGVGFLLPIYRHVNTYAALLATELPGHPEALGTADDLHARANALLAAATREEVNAALGRYVQNLAGPRTSAGLTDVVPCACRGQLTHLFIANGLARWGRYAPDSGRVDTFANWNEAAEDLVAQACASALSGHARAYALPAEELPPGAEIAGICKG